MNVRLWDTANGELIETYQGHRGWVFDVAISPDGSLALSGGGARGEGIYTSFRRGPVELFSLDSIVEAVNNVGAAPGDLVAILEALKEAGALRAELIII